MHNIARVHLSVARNALNFTFPRLLQKLHFSYPPISISSQIPLVSVLVERAACVNHVTEFWARNAFLWISKIFINQTNVWLNFHSPRYHSCDVLSVSSRPAPISNAIAIYCSLRLASSRWSLFYRRFMQRAGRRRKLINFRSSFGDICELFMERLHRMIRQEIAFGMQSSINNFLKTS